MLRFGKWGRSWVVAAGLAWSGTCLGQDCGWFAGYHLTEGDNPNPPWLLARFAIGSEYHLLVGGTFDSAGGHAVPSVAVWTGVEWEAFGEELGLHSVNAVGVAERLGGDECVYMYAYAAPTGGAEGWRVISWDGDSATEVAGIWTGNGPASGVAWFDDGSGARAYICGRVRFPGAADHAVLRWEDDEAWHLVSNVDPADPSDARLAGMTARVDELLVFDEGSGPVLYAFGDLGLIDGTPIPGIAKWQDGSWVDPFPGLPRDTATFLAKANEGAREAVYFSTTRSTPPGNTSKLIRWDGVGLTEIQLPGGQLPYAIAVDSEETPPTLYAKTTGELWKSFADTWLQLNQGPAQIHRLEVLGNGETRSLIAVGPFDEIGGLETYGMASWPVAQQFLDFVVRMPTGENPNLITSPGQTIELSVGAVGHGMVGYDWFYQDQFDQEPVALVDHESVSGTTTNALTIGPVAWEDEGWYTVRVSDTCGFIEETRFVRVKCGGDLNDDGATDINDVSTMSLYFGSSDAAEDQGDIDFDGDVDVYDFARLAGSFGCVKP